MARDAIYGLMFMVAALGVAYVIPFIADWWHAKRKL